jgi:hypothetical protein
MSTTPELPVTPEQIALLEQSHMLFTDGAAIWQQGPVHDLGAVSMRPVVQAYKADVSPRNPRVVSITFSHDFSQGEFKPDLSKVPSNTGAALEPYLHTLMGSLAPALGAGFAVDGSVLLKYDNNKDTRNMMPHRDGYSHDKTQLFAFGAYPQNSLVLPPGTRIDDMSETLIFEHNGDTRRWVRDKLKGAEWFTKDDCIYLVNRRFGMHRKGRLILPKSGKVARGVTRLFLKRAA